MTLKGQAVRVTVTDAWDTVDLALEPATPVAELKRAALRRTVGETAVPERYVVKFRGALVTDESTSLSALGATARAAFIVLPARRQPVR